MTFYALRNFVENGSFCKAGFIVEYGGGLMRASLLRRRPDGVAYLVNGRVGRAFWDSLPDLGQGPLRMWPIRPHPPWSVLEPLLRQRAVLHINGQIHTRFASIDWLFYDGRQPRPHHHQTLSELFEEIYGPRRTEEARIATGVADA